MSALDTEVRRRGYSPRHEGRHSVGDGERIASGLLGAGLVLWGVRSLTRGHTVRGAALAAVGGMLASRGATGRCPLYERLGVEPEDATRGSSPISRDIHVRHAIQINLPPDQIYAKWRDLASLHTILSHVKRIEVIDERRSRWVAEGPMDADVHWEAEITEDRPGEVIAWRSLPDSQVRTEGRVEFHKATGDRGTRLHVHLTYNPPGGVLGAAVAKLFRADPDKEIREDLRRFKQLVETGEVSTSESPSGRDELEPGDTHRYDGARRAAVPRSERDAAQHRSMDPVEQASKESFPASDAPAW